jgi:hypothetical protein
MIMRVGVGRPEAGPGVGRPEAGPGVRLLEMRG